MALTGLRIVLVEDDPDARYTGARLLEAAGAVAGTGAVGEAAAGFVAGWI